MTHQLEDKYHLKKWFHFRAELRISDFNISMASSRLSNWHLPEPGPGRKDPPPPQQLLPSETDSQRPGTPPPSSTFQWMPRGWAEGRLRKKNFVNRNPSHHPWNTESTTFQGPVSDQRMYIPVGFSDFYNIHSKF